MPADTPPTITERRISRALIAPLVLLLAALIGFSGVGSDDPLTARAAVVLSELIHSGWAPAAYLLGAYGYGTLLRRFLPIPAPAALLWSLGLAIMLTLTHGLGVLGLLSPIAAWISTGTGIAIAASSMRGKRLGSISPPNITQSVLLGCIAAGLGLYLVAGSSPPGALWDSEFGAYDSLSYHLQLPKEWIASGQIWPARHNVYAYHPGYIESAYAHLGLLAGKPTPVQSTHFFGIGLVLLAGWNVALAVRNWTTSTLAPLLGFAMVLLTPWTMVVSTISYNEPGVLALGSAALLLAAMDSVRPAPRGILLGILVGGAVGCKMTAIFFVAPSVAVILFVSSPRDQWSRLTVCGALCGALMLLPWMARNLIDTGNPVFPQLAGVFGGGHWTGEQLARYANAHRFDGTILERLGLLILPDVSSPLSVHVARFRGLTNLQWGLLPALTLVGLGVLLARRETHRRGAALLLALALPIIAWLAFTHLQSRFFVPMVPLAAITLALGCSKLRSPALISLIITIGALVWCAGVFVQQNGGRPNALLVVGPSVHTEPLSLGGTPTALTWTARLNDLAGEPETVYLLGDATPFYLRSRVLYSTTYDTPPIAAWIDAHPEEPAAWIGGLRSMGVDWIVINRAELGRLSGSGWLDPSLSSEHLRDLADTLGAYPGVELDQSRTAYRITEPARP